MPDQPKKTSRRERLRRELRQASQLITQTQSLLHGLEAMLIDAEHARSDRWCCTHCGRLAQFASPTTRPDKACPNCGSANYVLIGISDSSRKKDRR